MNYTNIDQSKKLVELCIDKYTCDLIHRKRDCGDGYIVIVPKTNDGLLHNLNYFDERSDDIPCWSVGALIDLLPKRINYNNDDKSDFYLFIDMSSEMPCYCVNDDCYLPDFPNDFLGGNLIDNIIKAIEWLKENKYL